MSRFRASNIPVAKPGACYITGRSSETAGPYIDTGKNIPGYGAVYVSRQAVEEMFDTLRAFQGKVGPNESEAEFFAKQEAEYNDAYNSGYAHGRTDFKNRMKELFDALVNSLGSDNSDSVIDTLSSVLADGTESSGEPGESEPVAGGSSGEDAPAPSSNKSDGVSDDFVGDLKL